MSVDCHTCAQEADLAAASPLERIYLDAHWRVAHATGSALPGWLVAVPRRHVTTIADLCEEEAAGLGPLLRRLSQALQRTTGCVKTYVMQYAEAEGFEHVHFHVVPRMADLPEAHRGPAIVHYLGRPDPDGADAAGEVCADIARYLAAPVRRAAGYPGTPAATADPGPGPVSP